MSYFLRVLGVSAGAIFTVWSACVVGWCLLCLSVDVYSDIRDWFARRSRR